MHLAGIRRFATLCYCAVTLTPVSETRDPSSPTVGYYLRTFGFLDRAVVDDPNFDLDVILAQKPCDQGRRIVLVDGRPTCTG